MAPPYMRMTPQLSSFSISDHLTAFRMNKAMVEESAMPAMPLVVLKNIQERMVGIMTMRTFFSFLDSFPSLLTFSLISLLQVLIWMFLGVIFMSTSDAIMLMMMTMGMVNRMYFEKEMVCPVDFSKMAMASGPLAPPRSVVMLPITAPHMTEKQRLFA